MQRIFYQLRSHSPRNHSSPLTPLRDLLVLTGMVLLLAACGMPQGNAADGKRWFSLNRCNGCHGEKGNGGKGPVIADTGLSFRRFLHKLRAPNSAIMPTFAREQLSDQDAADIYLWLHRKQL